MACLGFTTCPGSFPSSLGEKHPYPKSGQDLDPDKLVCIQPFGEIKPTQIFGALFFLILVPNPRVADFVVGPNRTLPLEFALGRNEVL